MENIHQYSFTKNYLMIYTTFTKFLREKLETVNKSISKKVETFVMFLYWRNGKYVSDFIYWLSLFDFLRSGNYGNNNIFLFYSFYPQIWKVSKQDILFARNVVWKWRKITHISSCTKRWMLLGCVFMFTYWLYISKAHWYLWSSVMQILTLKTDPKFCSRYI